MEVTSKCGPSAGLKVSAEDESVSGPNSVNNRKDGGGVGSVGNASGASNSGGGGGGGTLLQMHKPLAHLLAHRQWWKVCWVYGDQQKYYRQLYGRKKNLTTLRSGQNSERPHGAAGDDDVVGDDDVDAVAGPSSLLPSGSCNHTLE